MCIYVCLRVYVCERDIKSVLAKPYHLQKIFIESDLLMHKPHIKVVLVQRYESSTSLESLVKKILW